MMTFRLWVFAIGLLGVARLPSGECRGDDLPGVPPAPRPKVKFNRDVRPILSDKCFACHGPDKQRRKADLRLDVRDEAITAGAIVPGKPEKSELVSRILSEKSDEVMPLPSSRKTLSRAQKETLTRWIAEGAPYEAHWAYAPLVRPEVPEPARQDWGRSPIDAFILNTLEANGLSPSKEAGRRRLLRRLSLDLIGLPPSPGEVETFVADGDRDPGAYERVVDRLLDSPRFGERMAVPWLDLARWADTVGYHGDQNQRIFPYRDYVIESFNRNKPFDQFTVEQLAGDLLPNPTAEQLVATGFNRLNMMTREGGAQPKEYLAKYASDRVRTVSMTWLGSTMGCSECHDHKYDPFTMKDFYSLAAFFADVKQWGVYQDYSYTPNPDLRGWSNDHPFPPEIEVPSPYLERRRERLREAIQQLCRSASARWEADGTLKSGFESWAATAGEFLKAHPHGWMTPPATAPDENTVRQDDGSFLLTSRVKPSAEDKLTLEPGAGWVAAIRLEVLPHESHNGNIGRNAGASPFVQLSAAVKAGSTDKEVPLAFFFADADQKEERYDNGFPLLGVKDGWKTSHKGLRSCQASVWLLEKPVQLAAGDRLVVKLRTDSAGCVRLSVSPFGWEDPRRCEMAEPLAAALAAASKNRTVEHKAVLGAAHLLGTGWDADAFARYKALLRQVSECQDGRAFTMVVQAAEPLTTRVLPRGNWQDESGPIVEPAVPSFLPQGAKAEGRRLNRLDLARWLVSRDNPLTARVLVNRLWKQLFGTGICGSIDDVGAQGEAPTHPELLDWLAVELQESGWNVKRMLKLMAMSAAYRQDSSLKPEAREIDPSNRLLSSQSPRRLEAEFVRDNALAIAGLLNLELGGPSAKPYQPAGYYANLQFPDRDYLADADERQYRRGIYMHWQRTFLHPMLVNFDAPLREECTANRIVSNTPQQALTLLNDPSFVEAARVFARHLLVDFKGDDGQRLDHAFQEALCRPIQEKETGSINAFLAEQRAYYAGHAGDARRFVQIGLAPLLPEVSAAELAAWTNVCRVILNLHETMTRY